MCGIVGIVRWGGRPVRSEEIGDDGKHPATAARTITACSSKGASGSACDVSRSSISAPPDTSRCSTRTGPWLSSSTAKSTTTAICARGLQTNGHRFRGNSDTEVLVHGYEQFGARGWRLGCRGMFAFALYDRARRRLFLARDGFGIKPLYVRRTAHQLSFASEIRALPLDGQGPLSVDPTFTQTFLRIGYVPSPGYGVCRRQKVAPGTLHEIDLDTGETRVETFYRLAPAPLEDTRPDVLLERLRELLNASVRRHLMADVPTGLFLSGGLDSSALDAVRKSARQAPPKTFSIGFSSSDRGDETHYAALVAARAGNENVRIDLGPANLGDLDPIVDALEEPLADSAVLPLWYLCRGTAEHVKVALSGEGGDEVLGGYARYFWGPVVDNLRPLLLRHADEVLDITGRLPSRSLGVFNVARRAAKVAASVQLDTPARYLAWFDSSPWRSGGPWSATARTRPRTIRVAVRFGAHDLDLDPVQRLQYVDCQTMLLDNLLMKADKLSMAHSLEVRVPFLDAALVEFGLGLPTSSKNRRVARQASDAPAASAAARGPGFPIGRNAGSRSRSTGGFGSPRRLRYARSSRAGALVAELGFRRRRHRRAHRAAPRRRRCRPQAVCAHGARTLGASIRLTR